MLAEAEKSRREFEDLVGPMVTNITAANLEMFSTVLPEEFLEDITTGRLFAIGALRTDFETVVMIRDILSFDKISDRKKGVKALSSLDESERTQLQKMALRKFGYRGYLTGKDLPAGYFDYDLSCYEGTPTDPVGMLLVHITKEGMM
ncbi:MAG: hypothetical protein K6B14_11080 [Lachnospiraceae bacterium]|nr:hypothetical protein [Lachnospiraceae bacterium]